jgi:hypothetical protein
MEHRRTGHRYKVKADGRKRKVTEKEKRPTWEKCTKCEHIYPEDGNCNACRNIG